MKKLLIFSFIILISLPLISLAATGTDDSSNSVGTDDSSSGGFQNPIGADTIQELVTAILDIVIAVGVPVVIFFLVFTGFRFVTARGSETAISDAKRMFFWTVIGGLVLLGSKVLSEIIKNTIDQIVG